MQVRSNLLLAVDTTESVRRAPSVGLDRKIVGEKYVHANQTDTLTRFVHCSVGIAELDDLCREHRSLFRPSSLRPGRTRDADRRSMKPSQAPFGVPICSRYVHCHEIH